jgi:hypothetical protein
LACSMRALMVDRYSKYPVWVLWVLWVLWVSSVLTPSRYRWGNEWIAIQMAIEGKTARAKR